MDGKTGGREAICYGLAFGFLATLTGSNGIAIAEGPINDPADYSRAVIEDPLDPRLSYPDPENPYRVKIGCSLERTVAGHAYEEDPTASSTLSQLRYDAAVDELRTACPASCTFTAGGPVLETVAEDVIPDCSIDEGPLDDSGVQECAAPDPGTAYYAAKVGVATCDCGSATCDEPFEWIAPF